MLSIKLLMGCVYETLDDFIQRVVVLCTLAPKTPDYCPATSLQHASKGSSILDSANAPSNKPPAYAAARKLTARDVLTPKSQGVGKAQFSRAVWGWARLWTRRRYS